MKTFKEFIQITEKYYDPEDKLPSGKTPIDKTKDKIKKTPDTPQTSSKIRERRMKLKQKLRTHVSHGADNREVNTHSDSGVMVHQSKDKRNIEVDHPKSGIYYEIQRKHDVDGKPHHEISWNLSRKVEPEEQRKMAHTAKQIYHRHIQHRLPYGSVVSNIPASSKLERIYGRAGFGEPVYGRQHAKVGRMPSTKKQKKGKKSRLIPMNPED